METIMNSKTILFEYDGALFWRIGSNGPWSEVQYKAVCRSCGQHVRSGENFLSCMGESSQFVEHTICESRPDLAELRAQGAADAAG